jgi:hypothetical protein
LAFLQVIEELLEKSEKIMVIRNNNNSMTPGDLILLLLSIVSYFL